jgi:hypothetical protein
MELLLNSIGPHRYGHSYALTPVSAYAHLILSVLMLNLVPL